MFEGMKQKCLKFIFTVWKYIQSKYKKPDINPMTLLEHIVALYIKNFRNKQQNSASVHVLKANIFLGVFKTQQRTESWSSVNNRTSIINSNWEFGQIYCTAYKPSRIKLNTRWLFEAKSLPNYIYSQHTEVSQYFIPFYENVDSIQQMKSESFQKKF